MFEEIEVEEFYEDEDKANIHDILCFEIDPGDNIPY